MGACFSALDEPPEGGELAKLTDKLVKLGCARSTVTKALRVFWRGDKDGSGTIELKEFAKMFGLRTSNAFLPRMMSLFDVTGDGDIGALEFMLCLAQFYDTSSQAHVYFAWRLFDQDDSGSMTMEEFEHILNNAMSYKGTNKGFTATKKAATPDDEFGDRIVMAGRLGRKVRVKGFRQILKEADLDNNGLISFDEFKIIASNSTHIVAPAFELWTALENHSKPCWQLRNELKENGKLHQVQMMLSPKARKAFSFGGGRSGDSGSNGPQRGGDARGKQLDQGRSFTIMGPGRLGELERERQHHREEERENRRNRRRDDGHREVRGDERRHRRHDHHRSDGRAHHDDGDDRRRRRRGDLSLIHI